MIAAFAVAFAISLLLQPLLIRWLRRRALLDHPNHRSSHTVATPRGGGLAVVAGLLTALVVVVGGAPSSAVLGIAMMAALGAAEDAGGVPTRVRLLGQLCGGLVVGLAMVPGAGVGLPVIVAVVAATAWFLLYVNAFNFMDGVNGISGLQAAVVGAAFVGMGALWDVPGVMGWGAAIAGASIAFLPYNAVRARVFLGDVGSYGLGAAIALLTVHAWTSGVPAWAALAPSLVYCVDVLTTLCRRLLAHESVLDAHRSHIYQRLTDAGLTHVQVACFVAVASALCGGAALAAVDESARPWSLALAALVLSGYLLSPQALQTRRAHDDAITAGSR